MKTISIQQPYAELILRGAKRVENRTRPGPWRDYRGLLLLHAGKSRERLAVSPDGLREEVYDLPLHGMGFGAVVGRCELVDCFAVTYRQSPSGVRRPVVPIAAAARRIWLVHHEHVEGPYCLVLDAVERLERPFPFRGALGLFDADIEALEMEHGWPAVWLPAGPPARTCRKCGCTEHSPCAEGCEWVGEDLCSACVQ